MFQEEIVSINKMLAETGGKITGAFLSYDFSRLKGLISGRASSGGDVSGGGSFDPSNFKATGITHSGPKTITININKEMIGSLAINSYNVKEGVGEMEDLIREAIYRMFYSMESAQPS